MIAHIHHTYISNCAPQWTAVLVAQIARGNHLIDCDAATLDILQDCVTTHCSTIEKEIISASAIYEITSQQRNHLTTIEVDGTFTPEEYQNLFSQPSLVLIENEAYEWPVYEHMIECYKRDRDFGNIFRMLQKAVKGASRTLKPLHAGGNGHFVQLIERQDSSPEYKGICRHKIYAVTDSDRDSATAAYLPTPKAIYKFFSGNATTEAEVDRTHIDTLTQPHYHWHMWRKRAIENYFPPQAYTNIGLNATVYGNYTAEERNYKNVESEIKGYKKSNLPEVANAMSRADYESISDKLQIGGTALSEIRLFLLKMAKVI